MLKRALVITGIGTALILGSAMPAWASGWGAVDCSRDPSPYCQLGAGQGGTPPVKPPGEAIPKPGRPKDQGDKRPGTPAPPGDQIYGDSHLANCAYVRSDYRPPANGVPTVAYRPHESSSVAVQVVSLSSRRPGDAALAQVPGQGGGWYTYRCSGPGFRDGLYRAPVWIPDGQAAGAAVPSPEELAQQARSQLRLPVPGIVSDPAGTKLVNLPTWLWLDRGSWGAQSATASVPAASVTATATPTSVAWSMGDGAELTCIGPGTPFPAGADPQSASPDCGHTYHRSSAGAPGQAFRASATVRWTVTWSGMGTAGTFPDMTTSASAAFRVAEAQALGTGNR